MLLKTQKIKLTRESKKYGHPKKNKVRQGNSKSSPFTHEYAGLQEQKNRAIEKACKKRNKIEDKQTTKTKKNWSFARGLSRA